MIRWWLVLCCVILAGGTARAQLLSPGPLTSAHATIDGDDNCDHCHQSGKQVVARLCLDCHKDLGTELDGSRGLHGKQFKGKACEECHVEHLGRGSKLIRWPNGAMEKLDHRDTGWVLEGGHTKPKCLDCHKKSSPQGKPQFLATSSTCGSCHKDPHAGRFGTACQKCHSVNEWKGFDRKAFDHKVAKFQLTGKHAAVVCEKCHTGTPPKWQPLQFATCDSCHADPHKAQFKPKPCTACHDVNGWEVAADKMRVAHPKLSLAGGHAAVKCETCHDRGNDKPPSKGSACQSCHAPVHLAKFGNRCEGCHGSIRWAGLPEATGRDNHGKTRYPLAGKHAGVACADCHPKSKPQAKRFRNLAFATCGGCHADEHNGEFAKGSGGECAQCHTINGFAPTTFGVTLHATTAFALEGKHLATPCGSCHTAARPRKNFAVVKRACADCHANPHGTQFAKEMGQSGCATCHTPVDWHQSKIDHSIWPLVGTHAQTVCAACHGEQKKGAEPAAYRGVPRACEGCHDDVHAGQFAKTQPAKDCKTCHEPTKFQIAQAFDHKTTGYPLDGKHQPLACAKCHTSVTLRDGTTSVRWRLGYRQCKDCHANPHREGP
jgi:hypothetical protein